MGGSYDADLGALAARVSLDVPHTSKYTYTDALTPAAVQKVFTRLDGSITLGSSEDRWKVSLIGRNLTNETIVTSANEFPFTGGTGAGTAGGIKSDINTVVERPREIALELSFAF